MGTHLYPPGAFVCACMCVCMCVRVRTLALVVDLPRGDDLVEHGGEGLVLPADPRCAEWGHDELALADVRFHGNPASEGGGKVKTHAHTQNARAHGRTHTRTHAKS